MKVLFVCQGNICRSPMAQAYLSHRAPTEGLSHLVVESAGLLGIEGAPAAQPAIELLSAIGIDLSGHRSTGLKRVHLDTADFIVAMSLRQIDEIHQRDMDPAGEIFLLRAFEKNAEPALGAPDLQDPIGEPPEVYREVFRIIQVCVDHLTLHLKHLP